MAAKCQTEPFYKEFLPSQPPRVPSSPNLLTAMPHLLSIKPIYIWFCPLTPECNLTFDTHLMAYRNNLPQVLTGSPCEAASVKMSPEGELFIIQMWIHHVGVRQVVVGGGVWSQCLSSSLHVSAIKGSKNVSFLSQYVSLLDETPIFTFPCCRYFVQLCVRCFLRFCFSCWSLSCDGSPD